MKVSAKLNCDLSLVNRAAELTTHGQMVNAPLRLWFRSEHSPCRVVRAFLEFHDLETFVSVHFTRHGKFAEHFVMSNREDRGGTGDEGRYTPVTHGIETNAQELITMARKRLCYKSHKRTVAAMMKIKVAVGEVIPELPQFMVPECVYRNGLCPEFTECKPGIEKVMAAYSYYPGLFKVRRSGV